MSSHVSKTVVLLLFFYSSHAQTFYASLQNHQQIYELSCIPSSVEMILKYNKKVDTGYYELQKEWKNRATGSLALFNGKTIHGLTFTQCFNLPRNNAFPLDSLFKTIDLELKSGRKVIVALPSGGGVWHMWVVDHITPDGEFCCYSRGFRDPKVLEFSNAKALIRAIGGTDIMVYR